MITFIMILYLIACIEEIGLGAIIFFIIFGILFLGGLLWILTELFSPKYPYITKNCPWGYYKYGCQPDCPMHEHCWGPHPMKGKSTHHNHNHNHNHNHRFERHNDSDSGQSFLPDVPTFRNEDSDWRTTYMDDTRYDDRERDEEHDHDRFDNGGW